MAGNLNLPFPEIEPIADRIRDVAHLLDHARTHGKKKPPKQNALLKLRSSVTISAICSILHVVRHPSQI